MKIGIVQLILSVRDRPLHFLDEVSFAALDNFISGYLACRWMTPDQVEDPEETAWQGFTVWLTEETGVREELSWSQIVRRRSENCKDQAFDVFYSLFDSYLASNAQKTLDRRTD